MSNISIKNNLLALNGATVMNIAGKNGEVKCLVIPIELAGLFHGEKGVYLDQTAIPIANPSADRKDTHIIKQSYSKEKFAAMSEEEKKAIPIMGNAIAWGDNTTTAKPENKPASSTPNWL